MIRRARFRWRSLFILRQAVLVLIACLCWEAHPGAAPLAPALKDVFGTEPPKASIAAQAPSQQLVRITNASSEDLEIQLLRKGQDANAPWAKRTVGKSAFIALGRAEAATYVRIRIFTARVGQPPLEASYPFSPDAWYELFANSATQAWDIRRVPAS